MDRRFRWMWIVIIQILFQCPRPGNCLTKRFVASRDFSDRQNWQGGELPCAGETITFKNEKLPVFIDGKLSLESLEFQDGISLYFGQKMDLQLTDRRSSTCKHKNTESVFEAGKSGLWWDPDSWNCEKGDPYTCNSAVPDVHQMPCLSDDVVFEDFNQSLYYVTIEDPVPTIKSLKIGKKEHTTSSFYDFSVSTEGKSRIQKKTSSNSFSIAPLYVETEGDCNDKTGCVCHQQISVEQICKVKKNNCPSPLCSSPVKMFGFCCEQCGGEVRITHNGTLELKKIQELLKRVLPKPKTSKVDGYAAKMHNDHIYVYFLPKQKEGDFESPFNSFVDLFRKELNPDKVHNVVQNLARGSYTESIKQQKSVVTIIIVFICVVLLVALAIQVFKKQRLNELPFSFRRMSFAHLSLRSNRRASVPSSAHVVSFSTVDGRSFVNPTFNQPIIEEDETPPTGTEVQDIMPEVECPTQRENPLYAAAQKGQAMSFKALQEDHNEKEEVEDVQEKSPEVDKTSTEEISGEVRKKESLITIEDENEEAKMQDEDDDDDLEKLARSRIEEQND